MAEIPPLPHLPLEWVGAALDELMALPTAVRRSVEFALRFAQGGVKPDNVKPLKGFKGAGVLEVIENYDGDTYRAVYPVNSKASSTSYIAFRKNQRRG